jgi:hypothetical protein
VALAAGRGALLRKPTPAPLPPPQPALVETIAHPVLTPTPPPVVAVVAETPKAPEPKHKKPRQIAAVVPSPIAVVAEPPPPTQPEKPPEPDKPASLTVAITPWCDLTIDGKDRGRAPQTLELPAGTHHVECHHPSGNTFVRDVMLQPGGSTMLRERLFAPAHMSTLLKNVQFAIDDSAPVTMGEAAPGRHRITLYREGKIAETGWVDVRPEGCRLVDTPKLACEKP